MALLGALGRPRMTSPRAKELHDGQRGPQEGPRGLQDGPRALQGAQDGPKTASWNDWGRKSGDEEGDECRYRGRGEALMLVLMLAMTGACHMYDEGDGDANAERLRNKRKADRAAGEAIARGGGRRHECEAKGEGG